MEEHLYPSSIYAAGRKGPQRADFGIPRTMVSGFYGSLPDRSVNLFLTDVSRISNGTFGVVFKANLYVYAVGNRKKDPNSTGPRAIPQTPELIAVKKVLQDKRFKNRELQIIRTLDHRNIITLKFYFKMVESSDVYLCLILEYLPMTFYHMVRESFASNNLLVEASAKELTYQLLLAMEYLHALNVCHRDIKPQNLLVDASKTLLKVCDFGSAKVLSENEPNVAYICSRHYRAPELILGATQYTTNIDIWSCGCVLAEILIGRVLFVGEDTIDQLTQIIKVIGSPDSQDLKKMNPRQTDIIVPNVMPKSLRMVLNSDWTDFLRVLEEMLVFVPSRRAASSELLAKTYFDSCRLNGSLAVKR